MKAPSYYVYEDKGTWLKTGHDLTKTLNFIYCGFPCKTDLAGHCFYPQWDEPEFKNELKPAWRILPDGTCAQRWYWMERDHSQKHADCKLLGNGRCATKVPCYVCWDDKTKHWVLADTPNKATINDNGGKKDE